MDWIQLRPDTVVDIKEINCIYLDKLPPSIKIQGKMRPYILKCFLRGDKDDYVIVDVEYIDEVLEALNLEVKEDKNGRTILSIIPPGQRALQSFRPHVCISNQPEN